MEHAIMPTTEQTTQSTAQADRAMPAASAATCLVQRKCACGAAAGITDSCADCRTKNLGLGRVSVQNTFSGNVQRRLAVSQPHDLDEQEADRVAEEVMQRPARTGKELDSPKISPPAIQRLCAGCEDEELQRQAEHEEEEEEEQFLQGKGESGPIGEVSAEQTAQVENMKSGGEPLPPSSLNFFEQRFGHNFGSVRVHSDDRAAQSASALHALAYTTGQHIVFGAGHYSPDTVSGQKLLAHELTHVIQQGAGQKLRRQEDEQAEQEKNSEPTGLIYPDRELPPGLSLGLPGSAPEAGEEEPSAPEEEATVSRLPSSDSQTDASPEEQAISESPYPTGMSPVQLRSEFGSGQGLDPGVRASYESRYGHSLGHVRVHTDRQANLLCERFGAEAFTYDNHIAFREKAFSPNTPTGEKILRHELTHVLRSPVSQAGIFRIPAACTTNCPAASAPAFTPFANTGVNCYGYARSVPPSGFLDPGQTAGTAEFTRQRAVRSNPTPAASDLTGILPYFTPAGVKTNVEADLGSQISSDCTKCCFDTKRKIIAVSADPATGFARIMRGGVFVAWLPMVSSSSVWDYHWYRKDADRSWSHKHGGSPAQRHDESGTVPICNPCTADRNFTPASVNYNNVVGSWCV